VLATIVLAYAVIIGLNETVAGGPGRLLVLGYLLFDAWQISDPTAPRRRRKAAAVAVTAAAVVAFAAAAGTAAAATRAVTSGVVGALSFALTAAVIAIVGRTVLRRRHLDSATVAGVLAVYLLLALLFASLNQLLAAFNPTGYLAGVVGLPTASDQLYFSVVTMATIGYGDITPASQLARAVVVVEALTGQLYLVSVVSAVVGGWRGRGE
jgi:hypothetical protein